MKNKNSIILALMLACIFAVSVFVVMGGVKGESAYDVAVRNGFTGTEVEWLNSLKGGDGEDASAVDYQSMYQTCKQNGEISEDTTYLQFIQSLIDTSSQDKQLLAIQNSIRSSVSIFNLGNSSAGSGTFFRIDDNGTAYIVTNFHVTYAKTMPTYYYVLLYEDNFMVDPSNEPDRKTAYIATFGIKATYVGGSKAHDIAVIKITENDRIKQQKESGAICAATINQDIALNRTDLAVGTSCFAVGNGMGEGMSASQGIISVSHEDIELEDVEVKNAKLEMRLIRTTCLINGGNSGGGLYNSNGELIGVMNSKREYQSETNLTEISGVTYAIPSSVAVNIYNKIMQECNGTTITQPTIKVLGVSTTLFSCTSVYNTQTGMVEVKEVIKVDSTTPGSNAHNKLLAGDELQSYTINYLTDYQADITTPIKINHLYTLSDAVMSLSSGDQITITCLREGSIVDVTITVA